LTAQTGSLRGRDLSQFVRAFEEQNIFAASISQRIGDATTDSTAADNDNLCSTWESRIHVLVIRTEFQLTI
jgi:hypothetical protein